MQPNSTKASKSIAFKLLGKKGFELMSDEGEWDPEDEYSPKYRSGKNPLIRGGATAAAWVKKRTIILFEENV